MDLTSKGSRDSEASFLSWGGWLSSIPGKHAISLPIGTEKEVARREEG